VSVSAAFSDYIVYVDESGSPHLPKIDPNFPFFVLAFCIFEKAVLAERVVPAVVQFKFRHFGHDQVVLHEREIRMRSGPFGILNDKNREQVFLDELTDVVDRAPFTVVAVVLDQQKLVARYQVPPRPYEFALMLGLERVCMFLKERGQQSRSTHVIFERRGDREDKELELEFRRLTGGGNAMCSEVPIEVLFAHKRSISTGLQLADLVARPIGNGVRFPGQRNRALQVIQSKYRTGHQGQSDGYGFKLFPP
jgi:hypothetical protein